MDKVKQALKKKFINTDGTINKTTLVSFITLLVVLINQVLAAFGITPVHEDQAIAVINTVLTIAGLLGFVEPSANHNDNPQDEVKPFVTANVSTSSIKALTSLASQAAQMEIQKSESASVLASEKNKEKSAQ